MNKLLSLFAVALPIFSATPASAATQNGVLNVQLAVTPSCSINTSATGAGLGNSVLNFGTVSSLETGAVANTGTTVGAGAVNVLCNNGTAWNVSFDAGLNASGGQRYMKGGSKGNETVPYNLYSDSGYTASIDPKGVVKGQGTGVVQAVPIYGKIPAGTTLPSVGTYTDTVNMLVSY